MKRSRILAHRYARALFQVGRERDILEKLHEDMASFVRLLQENRDFYHFFTSPEVPRSEKEKKIEELFGDVLSNVFYNFLLVVLKKGRQTIMLDIAEAFNGQMDVYHNRVKAFVTSAVPLSQELQQEIRQRLAKQLNKEIVLVPQVDPAILGGLRITIDGTVIDGSLQGQLQKLRSFLLKQAAGSMN